MDMSSLIPIAAFALPYLAARQMISSAVMRLSDRERLALFPVGRSRQLLMWLVLPILAWIYLTTPLVFGLGIGAAVTFIVGTEIYQLLRIRRLSLSPEFKRTHSIATAIACGGVALALGAMHSRSMCPNIAFERMRRYAASFSAGVSAAHRST